MFIFKSKIIIRKEQMSQVWLQFIYISVEEMEAVASFITRRGRIAIGELAAKSDELIDLEQRDVAPLPGTLPDLDFGDLDTLAGPSMVEAAA